MDKVATARLMNDRFQRDDLIELFRRFDAGDETVLEEFRELIDLLHPEVVWDATELDLPDVPKVSHGVDGVIDFFRAWLAAWDDFHWTTSNFAEHGDTVTYDVDLVATKAGLTTELAGSHEMRFRDGKLAVWWFRRGRRSGPDT